MGNSVAPLLLLQALLECVPSFSPDDVGATVILIYWDADAIDLPNATQQVSDEDTISIQGLRFPNTWISNHYSIDKIVLLQKKKKYCPIFFSFYSKKKNSVMSPFYNSKEYL